MTRALWLPRYNRAMSDRVLIQEFVGDTTYIADGEDFETAMRYIQYAISGYPGCLCLTNVAVGKSLVVYGGPDYETREMSEDLTRAMCNALGFVYEDFMSSISSKKNEGGSSC